MVRLLTVTALAVFVVSALGATNAVTCGKGKKCPDNLPCCSQYGECGLGAYCLGGCDPFNSNSLQSCVPAPVCKSQDFKFTSLDGIQPNTKYLGDASKANWVSSGQPVAYEDSVLLTMAPDTVGTLLASSHYMWYGKVSATLRTSRGRGVVTAFILLSDVKDEIDYEFVGSDLTQAQSNFYFQGITNYQNGQNISLSDTFNNYHTYTIDWTPEQITWSIDGQVGRVKKRSDTWNSTSNRYDYPQSPARVQLSLWPGGLPTNGEGTINWAGGLVDWNSEDIQNNQYYYASIKDVSIQCYDPPSGTKRSGSTSYVLTKEPGTQDTWEITDKPTVLKSLRGSGTNMSAEEPSAAPASTSSKSGTQQSRTSSSAPAASSTEVATVPGLSGAGPGNDGQRGGNNLNANAQPSPNANPSSNSGSGSTGSGNTDSGSAPAASSSEAAAPSTPGGFVQGPSTNSGGTTQGNGAAGKQGERVLSGSIFAVLVAVAGMLML